MNKSMSTKDTSMLSLAVPIFISGVIVGASWPRLSSMFSSVFNPTNVSNDDDDDNDIQNVKAITLSKRLKYFCPAQSISYKNTNPLMAMTTFMQHVIDDQGIKYLDTRNNVGHVGWQHPHIVKAVQEQTSRCNANSRYLHPKRTLLAEKLLSHFPTSKEWCVFFVNSGSEANDLALRLARTHTKNYDAIVVDRAYHGHTQATLALSPYKYEHQGGEAYQEDWVHKVICPDMYRGKYCHLSPTDAAIEYAKDVKRACSVSKNLAAFFIESGMSVAGVILPPPGYLQACYKYVRQAGGVCIADEVQTGFGRFGTTFWGFEQQNVIPDIVTMGKPFGNGFPLAAVVCTKDIATSFTNGLEYFNTFGGNPVACAAGLAVLEIIEAEKLQSHAFEVGTHLKNRLQLLQQSQQEQEQEQEQEEEQDTTSASSSSLGSSASQCGTKIYIGDVRGSGLFLGIELVRDKMSKIPATAETSILCSRLKEAPYRMLTSIDGRHDNVIVIKPPMCFTIDDANRLVDAMIELLPTITEEDVVKCEHTPT